MGRHTTLQGQSLSQCYHRGVRASIGEGVRGLLAAGRHRALAASPLHYEDGDMRRNYDWLRAALAAGVTAVLVIALSRVVLTGLFVAFVSADPSIAVGFNLGLAMLTSGVLAVSALVRLWRHVRWRRYVPRPVRRWGAHRFGRRPPPARL
jgi:hypothetical protein